MMTLNSLSRRAFLTSCSAIFAEPALAASLTHLPTATNPVWPARPKGTVLLTIALSEQKMAIWDDGEIVAQVPVSTGVEKHPTPTGLFSIMIKKRFHRSNIYSAAPMPFMQRITWSGVALHQGQVPGRPASHGCIRLPSDVAQKLFTYTPIGCRVIITQKPVEPASFTHRQLFSALPQALRLATMSDLPPISATEEKPVPQRIGHVALFISAKEKKLFMRQNFQPVFESDLDIEGSDPLGTHLLTAMRVNKDDGAVQWSRVTMPENHLPQLDAAAALERIRIPAEARQEIARALHQGASLIISDQGLGREIGPKGGTDFIVLTRS
jgi:hypothetical protein